MVLNLRAKWPDTMNLDLKCLTYLDVFNKILKRNHAEVSLLNMSFSVGNHHKALHLVTD